MNMDDIDRSLSNEEHIVPSSGFVESVMGVVRTQAETPPPIPFPWKRAIPGILALVVILVGAAFEFATHLRADTDAANAVSRGMIEWAEALRPAWNAGANWLVLALFVALAPWLLTRQFINVLYPSLKAHPNRKNVMH